MSALLIAEHNNQLLNSVTLHLIHAAQQLNTTIDVVVIGYECQQVANEVSAIQGINKVILVQSEHYQHFLAENMTALIMDMSTNYEYILAPATTFGKNIMPRVAALLDVDQISDIITIEKNNEFKRPIYAGNAIETVQSSAEKKVITVRCSCFDTALPGDSKAAIEEISTQHINKQASFINEQVEEKERPDLTAAKCVVSGGRALGSTENFDLIYKLADKLGAAVGASRAAVDAGYVPNDMQVGQTGKVVAPELYIAIGISGAIQHLAGMKDSKTIVAINNDPDAPIMQIADYALEGDLFKILPELIEKI